MHEVDQIAVESAENVEAMEGFINQYEFFILKTAAKTAKHYISKNDDEWSIALLAFSDAVTGYERERGHFLSFAELMIGRRLIDYYRKEGRHALEIQDAEIENTAKVEHDDQLELEIEDITQVLTVYDVSFMDLVAVSPKAGKTRRACSQAVRCLLDEPVLLAELRRTKRLPVAKIQKSTNLPRKKIERHRIYIIAVAEILCGEYPCLSEYVSWIREV
jgi:RNA polymerase sigma factor